MIVNFGNKALERLWTSDDRSGLNPQHVKKLSQLLVALDCIEKMPIDLWAFKNSRPEALKGNYKGFYSIRVSGNWRLIFRFDAKKKHVKDVDYLDYH